VGLNEDSTSLGVKDMVMYMHSYVFHRISLSVYMSVSEERCAKSPGLPNMSSLYLQSVEISVDIEDCLWERTI